MFFNFFYAKHSLTLKNGDKQGIIGYDKIKI